jgi:hypothetical protein
MCPLLAKLIIGFFFFFFAAAVYSTNEANKAGLKQAIFSDVYATDTAVSCSLGKQFSQYHVCGPELYLWHL